METKVCTKCKVEKPKSEFYNTKTKFGNPSISPACRECLLALSRARNLKKRTSRPKVIIEDLEGEIWVPVIGFEEKYLVSNLGRVKSQSRWIYRKIVDKEVFMEGKLLSQTTSDNGYYPSVTLYGATQKEKYPTPVYTLVFFSFNPDLKKQKGFHVDHIDQDRSNSKLSNLQFIPERDNYIKRSLSNKKTSKYAGVSRDKVRGKWQTGIRYKGGKYALGRFDSEEEAAQVYQNALTRIEQGLHPIH